MDLNAHSQPLPAAGTISDTDRRLIKEIQQGLPLVPHPYAEIGSRCDMPEAEVIERIGQLLSDGVIKRLGVVVRHRELGYRANAMVVWDIPDTEVAELGRCIGRFDFVTLCYRRPRRLPEWPYNLFCMIHGQDRDSVLEKVHQLELSCGLADTPHEILFSQRRFKQRGALYSPATNPDSV